MEKIKYELTQSDKENLDELKKIGLRETIEGNLSIDSLSIYFIARACKKEISIDDIKNVSDLIRSRKDQLTQEALDVGYPKNEKINKILATYTVQIINFDNFLKGVELGKHTQGED